MTELISFAGQAKQAYGITTAIDKQQTIGDIEVTLLGITGDESADPKHHGGKERALHHYPQEHYQYWQTYYQSQNITRQWLPSSMGENISTRGFDEDNVCIGDRFQWGEAVIEVSQPRSPCFKLNKRWNIEDFSQRMQQTNKCGWLYRVITPGIVKQGASFKRIARVDNAMTIAQVCNSYFGDPLNKEGLTTLLSLPLSTSWRNTIENRLATGELENWNFRLFGHP